jgi:hypothetical protein
MRVVVLLLLDAAFWPPPSPPLPSPLLFEFCSILCG